MLVSWFTWKLLVESPKGLRTKFPRSFNLPEEEGETGQGSKVTARIVSDH